MQILTPDICIIGAGPGGLAAASLAASFGVTVVLVEKHLMGGNSLHYGCIPSKALLTAAKRVHDIRESPKFGIKVSDVVVDHKHIASQLQAAIAAMAPNVTIERYNGLGVNVVKGEARFIDKDTVSVGETEIKARRFIIATGSFPFIPPVPGLDRIPYFTNETIFTNTHRFAHMLVLGGGSNAVELAQAHRRLGSEVTIIEPDRLLSRDDPELRDHLVKVLRSEGIRVLENARLDRVEPFGANIQVVFAIQDKTYSVEGTGLLVAIGRRPAIDRLNLEIAGIKFSETGILVNSGLKTSNAKVYAIGDATGEMPTSHLATHHATIAVKNALFHMPLRVDHGTVPWVTFTDPELAHVGMTEDAARKKYGKLTIARWPYFENDRAQAMHQTSGLLKVIATVNGRILGAGIVGAQAGDVIQMWSLAMQKGLTLKAMATIVSPYPTLSEINKRAAATYMLPRTQEPLLRRMLGLLARMR